MSDAMSIANPLESDNELPLISRTDLAALISLSVAGLILTGFVQSTGDIGSVFLFAICALIGIVLLVSGTGKEDAVSRLRSGEISDQFPASALHRHGNVQVLVVA